MNDDNKEKNKDELKHHEGKNSKQDLAKQDVEKLSKGDDTSGKSEIIEDKDTRQQMGEMITSFMGSFSRPRLSPFESKITEKHIDKILDIKEKYDDNVFKDTQSSKKFHLIYTVIGASLFVFLTLFLVGKHSNLLEDIIKFLIGLVGGIGIGYGFKSYKDRD